MSEERNAVSPEESFRVMAQVIKRLHDLEVSRETMRQMLQPIQRSARTDSKEAYEEKMAQVAAILEKAETEADFIRGMEETFPELR